MHKTKAGASVGSKAAEGEGVVVGYAATFDREPDFYGDVIAPGAFKDTLEHWDGEAAKGRHIPVLYAHDTDSPFKNIGQVEKAEEDERGLRCEMRLDMDNEVAREAFKLLKEGRLYQMSFAYDVVEQRQVELDGGRKANQLDRVDLFEVSLAQIPANRHAEVVSVKAAPVDKCAACSKAAEEVPASVAREARERLWAIETEAREAREEIDRYLDGGGDDGDRDEGEDRKRAEPEGPKGADGGAVRGRGELEALRLQAIKGLSALESEGV